MNHLVHLNCEWLKNLILEFEQFRYISHLFQTNLYTINECHIVFSIPAFLHYSFSKSLLIEHSRWK